MLVKNAITKAIKAGMVPDVRERMIAITNPVNGQCCSCRRQQLDPNETVGQWKVHGSQPDQPQFDNFYSTYVDNLTQALRLIK